MKKLISSALLFSALALSSLNGQEAVPGVRGTALRLDSIQSCLSDPRGTAFALDEGMSYGFWLKADKLNHNAILFTGLGRFTMRKRQTDTRSGFYFKNQIIPGSSRDVDMLWAPDAFPWTPGKWEHFAFTYSNKTGIMHGYVNGKHVVQQHVREVNPGVKDLAIPKASPYKQLRFSIGSSRSPLKADFDEFAIYGRELSAEEVGALYQGNPPDGALALYLMDNPENLGLDSSPNHRNLEKTQGLLSPEGLTKLGGPVALAPVSASDHAFLWTRHAGDKCFTKDSPSGAVAPSQTAARLARNEAESFQLVISARQDLKNVSIEIPPFRNGDSVLATKLELVGYVSIPILSQTTLNSKGTVFGEAATQFDRLPDAKPGLYPDVIRPYQPVALIPKGECAPAWVTVTSTSQTKPGTYSTTAVVTADGGFRQEAPLSVVVWDFTLPERFHSNNGAISGSNVLHATPDAVQVCQEMRCDFSNIDWRDIKLTFDKDGNPSYDEKKVEEHLDFIQKHKMTHFYFPEWGFYCCPKASLSGGAKWRGLTLCDSPARLSAQFKNAFPKYLKKMCAQLRARNMLDMARITLVDEPSDDLDYQLCTELSQLIKEAVPELQILVTKWPVPQLANAKVDIWCLGMFQLDWMKAATDKGQKLEWYPNWHYLIDRPTMDSRMLGFAMWKYNLQGILYWSLSQGWNSPETLVAPQFVYSNGRVLCGTGILAYPGQNKNMMPSIRLVMSRDAYEDYEYLYLLNERATARKNDQGLAILKNACDAIVPVYKANDKGNAWEATKWETNVYKLDDWRTKIAEEILNLQ